MDLGASRRGVDMGPSAVRVTRIGQMLRSLGFEVQDEGDIHIHVPESLLEEDGENKFEREILASCQILAKTTRRILDEGAMPLILGGDHSLSMGSVAGMSDHFASKGQRMGVLWLDAHGDINTPSTSLTGNVHGMPLAHILGLGNSDFLKLCSQKPMVSPKNVVLVGIRDLDPAEKSIIRELGIKTFTMRDIDELGLRKVMDEALRIAGDGTHGVHVSCDMDWVDPDEAPGVGTPVRGGSTYREAHLAMEIIYDSGKLSSLEIVEVNPVFDVHNRTAEFASGLILSAFGKKIL